MMWIVIDEAGRSYCSHFDRGFINYESEVDCGEKWNTEMQPCHQSQRHPCTHLRVLIRRTGLVLGQVTHFYGSIRSPGDFLLIRHLTGT